MMDKTESPSVWKEWDQHCVWHPFTQMKDYQRETPLMIERGEGVYLYDTEGRRYLDGVASLWVNVHGHCVREIDSAISEQMKKIAHSTLLGLANVPSAIFAKSLLEKTPQGLSKVFYSDSGSTAAEIAVKIAYQFWSQQRDPLSHKKKVFAHITNSYHGDTVGSVSVGGIDLFHKIYKDLLFKTVSVELPESYRYQGTQKQWAEEAFFHLEKVFKDQHHVLAGIIIEPLIQGAAGMLIFPPNYLKKMRELCDRYDVLMIVDEVATGFGRTGTLFACEQEGVSPDMMILAKGITGGYLPLAVTLTTDRIFDAFFDDYKTMKTFFHGHTYTGNPLACAAAQASLELFDNNSLLSRVQNLCRSVEPQLKKLLDLDHVGDIRRCGMMIGVELVQDKKTKKPYLWEEKQAHRVAMAMRERGVIIRPLGNVLVLMPPLVIFEEQMHFLLKTLLWAIRSVTEKRK